MVIRGHKMGPMKIVVRVPNWIGDSILALPSLLSLGKNYPQAEVWILSKPWVKDVFSPDLPVSGLIPLPEDNGIKSLRRMARRLHEQAFDLSVLLTNSFASALLFSLAKIPERWGYATDGRGLFLTKSVRVREEERAYHQVEYYLRLLSGLGLKTFPPDIRLTVTAEEKAESRNRLLRAGIDLERPLVLLNPGAAYGPAKRWPAERFARVASALQKDKRAETAIIGSADEAGIAESVASSMEIKPVVFSGQTTLRQLLGLISQASLFVTNDSGPMHMANALRVPVVAVFGPTDPAVTRPFHPPSAILKKDAACWPCFYRKCPYDHRCMTSIAAEEVADAAKALLP